MNKDQFSGMWHEFKGKIKEKWGKLTDDDVAQINGKWEQLSGKLQKRYGWAKEQAEREMTNWCTSCEHNRERSQQQWRQNEREHPGKDDEHKEKKRKAS